MSEKPQSSRPVSKRAGTPTSSKSGAPPQLPPRVVRKKKKSVLVKAHPDVPGEASPAEPASELVVPAILVAVGVFAFAGTTLMVRPEGAPLVLWLGIRMVILVISAAATYGALFVAAQVVDADYGYISTGAVKVAAIVLTQAWFGDLVDLIPIPFAGSLLAFLVTYAMFKYFFELDDMAAISSMVVVRLMHWLAFVLVFIAIIGAMSAGANLHPLLNPQPDAPQEFDPAGNAEVPDDDVE